MSDQAGATGAGSAEPVGAPEIPGYQVRHRLGAGAGGVVWSAVRVLDRARVAIKVIGVAGDPARTDGDHRAELAALRGVHHPHVVRLIEDLTLPDGRLAVVLDEVRGGTLARMVQARGHLTPAETVTVLTALATTLADLHRLGVTHADLSPGNVLFQLDGRPMLADLGRSRVAGVRRREVAGTAGYVDPAVLAGAAPSPASDVYSLAALGWLCLVGEAPGPALLRPPLRSACPTVPEALAAAIEAALDPDPIRRIDAAELAYATYAACPTEPVELAPGPDPAGDLTHRIRLHAAAEPGNESVPRWRVPRWRVPRWRVPRWRVPRWLTRTALVGALVAVVIPGLVLVLRPPPNATPSPGRGPAPAELASARAAAFAQPDLGPGGFDAPGSRAWLADAAALSRLKAAGLHYEGLRIELSRVTLVADDGERAELTVAVRTSAYDVVDNSRAVRQRAPASDMELVHLHLLRTGSGWRIEGSG
jgi:hypothetical protein